MARINIEDSLFTDPRFKLLEQKTDPASALGIWVYAARVAQTYWRDEELVPEKTAQILIGFNELVECGWLEQKENGYYFQGSEKHFAWLVQKINAGRRGGNKSVEVRRKRNQAALNRRLSGNEPSDSDSDSDSDSKNKTIMPKASLGDCVFEEIYKNYPRKAGKAKGLKTCRSKIKSKKDVDRFRHAVNNYRQWVELKELDRQYIKHFSTFANQWQDYVSAGWVDTELTPLLQEQGIVG